MLINLFVVLPYDMTLMSSAPVMYNISTRGNKFFVLVLLVFLTLKAGWPQLRLAQSDWVMQGPLWRALTNEGDLTSLQATGKVTSSYSSLFDPHLSFCLFDHLSIMIEGPLLSLFMGHLNLANISIVLLSLVWKNLTGLHKTVILL